MKDRIIQKLTMRIRGELRLVPPLADEFEVYGDPETVERAREWALEGRYLLAQGVPSCAHGMCLMDPCPNDGCLTVADLDHVNLWVPADLSGDARPFLLHHPYADGISKRTRAYGRAHGLDVRAGYRYPRDDWYGGGTIAVRLTILRGWPMWPIEAEAAALLTAQPQRWPDWDDEEVEV